MGDFDMTSAECATRAANQQNTMESLLQRAEAIMWVNQFNRPNLEMTEELRRDIRDALGLPREVKL
jgi:hypothetical protein